VTLVLPVLLCGLVLGWLLGGRLDRLGRIALHDRWLVLAAAAVQLAGALLGGGAYVAGLVASALLAVRFLARNRGLRGTGLIALGLLANALVVGVNGAMPVSAHAAARAGADIDVVASGQDPRHELAHHGTRLSLLGDVIPVRLPWHREVVSLGDVLLAAGIAQLAVVGMGVRTSTLTNGLGRARAAGARTPRPGPRQPHPAPGARHAR
jgi:hypothetical protein